MRSLVILASLLLAPAARLAFHPHTSGISRPSRFHSRVPASASSQAPREAQDEQKLEGFISALFSKATESKATEKPTDMGTNGEEKEEKGMLSGLFSKPKPKPFETELPIEKTPSGLLTEQELVTRKALFAGILAQPVLYAIVRFITSPPKPEKTMIVSMKDGTLKDPDTMTRQDMNEELEMAADTGYANVAPRSEQQIIEEFEEGRAVTGSPDMYKFIAKLEKRQGAAFSASSLGGRWVMPWIGGWQRIWSSEFDTSYIGGPVKASFKRENKDYYLYSARNFFYGPGPGGMTTEYLFKPTNENEKANNILLARAGVVENEGDNQWSVVFPDALREFETESTLTRSASFNSFEKEVLKSDVAIGLIGDPAPNCRLQTTYLSQQIWVLRDTKDPSKISVYRRSATQAVVDRRGLIADGQVKPPKDDNIRFGGLLFSDKTIDYNTWDEKVLKDETLKRKLLD
mmetsp:Transcript_44731/g.78759  ORF Transcript_44731/g.78759 Transcript_44731/m.78759 type:complete len:460 (+) Transcript_44731:60-1439(+)